MERFQNGSDINKEPDPLSCFTSTFDHRLILILRPPKARLSAFYDIHGAQGSVFSCLSSFHVNPPKMSSLWSSPAFGVLVRLPKRGHNKAQQWAFPQLKKRTSSFLDSPISSSSSSHSSSAFSEKSPVGYDPEELLPADLQPRKASKQRSWFVPNGQYIRELPCPNCRGRGYTPCTQCGIERPRPDCSLCNGKGMVSSNQCHGDCVIWEESINERPWEKARSVSPLRVKEDEEVDDLEIKLDVKRKRKRTYQSSAPEVNLKISRSLKLNVCRF